MLRHFYEGQATLKFNLKHELTSVESALIETVAVASTASLEASATSSAGPEVAGSSESLLVDLLFDFPVRPLGVGSAARDLVKKGLGLVVEGLRVGGRFANFTNLSFFEFLLVLRAVRGRVLLLLVQ